MQGLASLAPVPSVFDQVMITLVFGITALGVRMLFQGVPVGAWLRSVLPPKYRYAMLQLDNLYCVQYRRRWSPLWFSYRWVQPVPTHIHTRRTWWGKLVRTKRNWRIARFTADYAEAEQQLARLKARHAALSREPARQTALA